MKSEAMANELFFVIGLTILTGFISTLIFDKTRISQVILLMIFGFILGPALGIIDVSEDSVIVSILPFISTLAMVVLLFDGGMSLDIFAVAKAIPKSTLFSVVVFLFSTLLVGIFAVFAIGWPILQGLLLGAVVGGTSSAIVIAMVEKTGIKEETKSLLTVESTLTDALSIIIAVIIVDFLVANQALGVGDFFHLLFSSFTLALTVGLASGLAWMFLISQFKVKQFSYMLTLALVFGLFAVTEAIKGNGGFAVFVFGLMLGNVEEINKFLKWDVHRPVGRTIKIFQEEITFFVRTFFFVYMGLLLAPSYFNVPVLIISVLLLVLMAAARLMSTKMLLPDAPKRDSNIVVSMLPRGLAAAVLATLPFTRGIDIPYFREIVFAVLLFTNIAGTAGVFIFDKPGKEEEDAGKSHEEKLTEAVKAVEKAEAKAEAKKKAKAAEKKKKP